jgi:NTP pyrophosphatase (non-canonical NTP hydrolase)
MGNRDNAGRFTGSGQEARMQANAQSKIKEDGDFKKFVYGEAAMGQVTRTPESEAEEVIKNANHHDSMRREHLHYLSTLGPSWATQMRQLTNSMFSWFKHMGFWREDHSPMNQFTAGDGSTVAITLVEYTRLKKAEKIALIHSELSEMLEAIRKDDWANEGEELADIQVRMLDYAGGFGHDLGASFIDKMEKNFHRPFRHGKKF